MYLGMLKRHRRTTTVLRETKKLVEKGALPRLRNEPNGGSSSPME